MKVTAERIPEAQAVLEVELDDERVQKSLEQASRRLQQRYRIPGFRKGKAPRRVVERALGADLVFEEAVERMIPEAYDEAIQEQGLTPIGPPQLEIVERGPVRFKATVPLEPEVDLGDYRSITADKEQVEIRDDTVADAILEIQRRHAVLEPVDRPLQLNDRVRLDIRAEVDGETVLREEGAELSVREGMTIGVPGVAEKIVGLEKGPEREFSVDVAEDWDDEAVAGKAVQFYVTLHDVKQEILPEPDDDLAAEVGEFESFDELRNRVVQDLREAEERRATEAFHQELIAAVIAKATVEYPPVLIEHEIDHMISEIAQQTGQDLDAFRQRQGAQAEELRQGFRPRAEERVLRGLVISELARSEEIAISEAEVEAEITRMTGEGPQAAQVRALFDNENGRTMVHRNLETSRTLERLAEIAAQNADGGGPAEATGDLEAAGESSDAAEAADTPAAGQPAQAGEASQ